MGIRDKIKAVRKAQPDQIEKKMPAEIPIIEVDASEDEYILFKALEKEHPEVAISYALNKIDDLKGEVISLRAEVTSLKDTNDALSRDLERTITFKIQLDKLMRDIKEKENVIASKESEKKKALESIAVLERNISDAKRHLQEKDAALAQSAKKIKELENASTTASLEAQIGTLKKELEEKRGALSMREAELVELRESTAKQDADLGELRKKTGEMSAQIGEFKIELEEKKGTISSKESLIKELSRKVTALNVEAGSHKKSAAEKDIKITGMSEKLAINAEKIKALEKQLGGNEESIYALSSERDELKEKVKQLEVSLNDKEEEASQLDSDFNRISRSLSARESELGALKKELRRKEDQFVKFKEEMEGLSHVKASKDSEIRDLENRVDALVDENKRMKNLEDRFAILDAKIAGLKVTVGMENDGRLRKSFTGKEDGLEEELDAIIEFVSKKSLEESHKSDYRDVVGNKIGELNWKSRQERSEKMDVRPMVKSYSAVGQTTAGHPMSESQKKLRLLLVEKKSIEKLLEKSLGYENANTKETIYRKKLDEISRKVKEIEGNLKAD